MKFDYRGRALIAGAAILVIFMLALNAASAQQSSPPEVQALRQRVLIELNGNIQCNTNLVDLQQRLDKEVAELTALKEKYEPTKKQDCVPLPPEKK